MSCSRACIQRSQLSSCPRVRSSMPFPLVDNARIASQRPFKAALSPQGSPPGRAHGHTEQLLVRFQLPIHHRTGCFGFSFDSIFVSFLDWILQWTIAQRVFHAGSDDRIVAWPGLQHEPIEVWSWQRQMYTMIFFGGWNGRTHVE